MRLRSTLAPAMALVLSTAAPWAGDPDHTAIRGVTISTPTAGREWGTPAFDAAAEEIAALGGNWLAIHPYAWIGGDGSVRFDPIDASDPPAPLARPTAVSREKGLALFVKPHLGYWGSPFTWRGEIEFETDAEWERFFSRYQEWIVQLAAATRGATGFCIGTELDRTLGHEDEWRAIIAAVRAVTDAQLTYAPNWDRVDDVPFWDALDCIGVQAYFPLSREPDPDATALRRGWKPWIALLRKLHEDTGKPVVFTELGYDAVAHAAERPWEPRPRHTEPTEAERALQRRCHEAAFAVLAPESEWLRGAFLWKWFPGERLPRDYRVQDPDLAAVIGSAWSAGP